MPEIKSGKKGAPVLSESDDMTVGRGIVFQGSASEIYVTENIFKASGTPYYNAGELILLENLSTKYVGDVESVLRNNTEEGGEVKYKIFKDCNGPIFFE